MQLMSSVDGSAEVGFQSLVKLDRTLALHNGFPTETDARKWVQTMEKKIQKHAKKLHELMH